MTTAVASFDSKHQDLIHDAQMDYYGKRLATCSSDRTIKLFNIVKNTQTHIKDLTGHEGPVWQVCWAHPKFGSKLASCSYDRKVIIWSEEKGNWARSFVYDKHQLSVNSIAWAPHEFGLALACGSSDGFVSIGTQKGADWEFIQFQANAVGVNAVSWAPMNVPSALSTAGNGTPVKLATAGSDNNVMIWRLDPEKMWVLEATLEGHHDWVRDVAWAPNPGLPYSTVASCSQDGRVAIWTQGENSAWSDPKFLDFKSGSDSISAPVWRVSWSLTGNILAVACGDNTVSLWKEAANNDWERISTLNENEEPQITSSEL